MYNKTIVLKQYNSQTHDRFQEPILPLFGRHKCMVPMHSKFITQMKDGTSFVKLLKSDYS